MVKLYKILITLHEILRWDYIIEYSKEIKSLLGDQKLPPNSAIEDPRTILQVVLCPLSWFQIFLLHFGWLSINLWPYNYKDAYLYESFLNKQLPLYNFYLESWGANLFESCMGADGNILCWQAITILDPWTACWLVSCKFFCFFFSSCFIHLVCHIDAFWHYSFSWGIFASVKLIIVFLNRFLIVFSLEHSQQSIQNLWIFKLNLLLYRFDHVLMLHHICFQEFSLKKRRDCYGNSSPL